MVLGGVIRDEDYGLRSRTIRASYCELFAKVHLFMQSYASSTPFLYFHPYFLVLKSVHLKADVFAYYKLSTSSFSSLCLSE